MNEDDFIYYKDDKNNLMSGGFSMNLLALKNGLSPLSGIQGGSEGGSGGLHDTDYSQEFKDHIIPSFLHYQLAGEHDNYSQKMSELLNVYEDHNEENENNENENEDQEGGDLYEKLLDLVTMNKSNKNRNKNKISRKEPKINKNTKNNKKTKKNKKQKDKN
jgi:hypothetical protein